jgi:heme-degrading monooxygenase HmoA
MAPGQVTTPPACGATSVSLASRQIERGATVSVIETVRFRLQPDADEDAFLRADKRVQAEFAYQQPGLLRRTTARGDDGHWIVITLWRTASEADAMTARWSSSAAAAQLMTHIDADTVDVGRYTALA